jgi:DNA polymerase III delta prime subunit
MIISYLERRPNLDDIDFKHEYLHKLQNITVDELPNLIFSGYKSCGKTTLMYAFFASLLDKKIYDIRNNVIELDRKIFNYRSSIYHIEFNPCEHGSNDKVFIQSFLRSYIESRNIGLDIPKIVFIKNANHLSKNAQMALRMIIEKNFMSSRFVFEISQTSEFQEPLRSRCLNIRIPLPKIDKIKDSLRKMSIEENIDITDEKINTIIDNSYEFNFTKSFIDLKKCYGIYNYYKFTKKDLTFINDDKIKELIDLLECKKIVIGNFEKIRNVINELYINLFSMKELILYLFYYFYNKNIDNNSFLEKIVNLTVDVEININKGNKECIHAEYYSIALFELLLCSNEFKNNLVKNK